ncbi:hypothetical protein Scep_005179 [Stephania cephalantha]|uniref:Uncharacterized protein n=1 Tax=Stephania cephalantha TaxID=152367 RepID=A0AAP0PX95_9MAGN
MCSLSSHLMWSVKGHRRFDLKVGKCMARGGDQANAWGTVEIKQTWLVESRRGDTLVGGVIGVETLLHACGCTSSDVVPRDASAHRMVRNHMHIEHYISIFLWLYCLFRKYLLILQRQSFFEC